MNKTYTEPLVEPLDLYMKRTLSQLSDACWLDDTEAVEPLQKRMEMLESMLERGETYFIRF